MSTEEWRRVPDVDQHYEVSSHGRVRSFTKHPDGVLMKQGLNPQTGYFQVGLRRDGRQYTKPIHWWVTLAFFGPREPGMVVRHLDGNPHNNHVSNLAYGTHAENMADASGHGTLGRALADRTHCKSGHPFNDANTHVITKKGGGKVRRCRVCDYTSMLRAAERNLAVALAAIAQSDGVAA